MLIFAAISIKNYNPNKLKIMKKVLLAAAVLVLGTSALSAQKATPWFLGGNVKLEAGRFDGVYTHARATVMPQVGYMFNDSWGIALDLGYSLERKNKVNHTVMGAGLSGLYVMKITDKFFYTPSLRVGYNMLFSDPDKGDKFNESSVIGASLNFMAFEFRPSCHWGFTLGFGSLDFAMSKKKDADDSKYEAALNVGHTAVGFKYYF